MNCPVARYRKAALAMLSQNRISLDDYEQLLDQAIVLSERGYILGDRGLRFLNLVSERYLRTALHCRKKQDLPSVQKRLRAFASHRRIEAKNP